jgi:hypothetical protein
LGEQHNHEGCDSAALSKPSRPNGSNPKCFQTMALI